MRNKSLFLNEVKTIKTYFTAIQSITDILLPNLLP